MYTNKLISETSVYLLQHAHNPVNWFTWGEEAFKLAKEENKPILLSIGYAACHWCHVMEKESFEDVETASLMNKYFINIKIDREERPDIDAIYMDAVQAITGSGGWPLHVFLTPDKKPFYGGTYFPPERKYNRLSWKEVLTNIADAYTNKYNEIEEQANKLTQHLQQSNFLNFQNLNLEEEQIFNEETDFEIASTILKSADMVDGGFGNAPKFLQTYSIQYLLRHYHFTKNINALNHAVLSLNKMISGGIYDQLGGGFSRYSTDAQWHAPHFEKMLYDNALMVNLLSEAYQLTNNKDYKRIIEETLEFVLSEMTAKNEGFYTAFDADSEGEEGKFYTWTKAEIENVLKEKAKLFCSYYNITERGNWENTNILFAKHSIAEFAQKQNITENELSIFLIECKKILFEIRVNRIKPNLDDKVLLGWNALMITAFCKAFAATGNLKYKQTAIEKIYFIENNLKVNSQWKHTYKNGKSKIDAFLDDYAYLIEAYIYLQEISADSKYLIIAKQLTQHVLKNYSSNSIFFNYTNQNQPDILVHKQDVYDGALPSANAIMAKNLDYLGIVFSIQEWQNIANKMLQNMVPSIINHPNSFAVWASLVQQKIYGTNEIALCGKSILTELPKLLQKYIPNKVLQTSIVEKKDFPLLKNRFLIEKNTFYLCRNNSCYKPFDTIEALLAIV